MSTDRTNPFVFVVGCPRSGTTLLQRMLDNHPQLAVANDAHFVPLAVVDEELGVDPPLTPELVEWVRSYKRFHRLGLGDADVDGAAKGATTYAEFVGRLYTAYAAARGKRLAGEKTPDYVKHLPRLHGLFPGTRFVHIVRDGRDVALSAREWAVDGKGPSKLDLWEEEPVAVCALWWQWMVRLGLEGGAAVGPATYHQVSYEELVDRPEEVLAGVAAFLELADSPEMAGFHVGRTKDAPGLSAKSAWLPATRGLRQWREELTDRELALFDQLAGDVLDRLGYPASGVSADEEVVATARRARVWWESRHSHTRGAPSGVGGDGHRGAGA